MDSFHVGSFKLLQPKDEWGQESSDSLIELVPPPACVVKHPSWHACNSGGLPRNISFPVASPRGYLRCLTARGGMMDGFYQSRSSQTEKANISSLLKGWAQKWATLCCQSSYRKRRFSSVGKLTPSQDGRSAKECAAICNLPQDHPV